MDDDIPLRERVKTLEATNLILQARVTALESQHMFGVEQMNRIEATQLQILQVRAGNWTEEQEKGVVDQVDQLDGNVGGTAAEVK